MTTPTPPISSPPSRAAAARFLAQSAKTAQLMGADFLPVYRAKDPTAGPTPDHAPGDAPAAPIAATPTPATTNPVSSAADPAHNQRLLDTLRERYTADAPHKVFNTPFTNIVFGEGNPAARLMFVGEAPGADEDRTGRPFVGRAGQLLERMILAMGIARSDCYIANILKTRPPNNATPTLDECAVCLPYILEQIALIRPEVIVTLGLTATRALLATNETMGAMRGRWRTLPVPPAKPPLTVEVMPTFHPAFILRQYTEENRNKVWSDLRQVMAKLGWKGPQRPPAPPASQPHRVGP